MGLLISNKGFATNPLSKLHPPMKAHSQYAAFVQKAYPMVASFVILSKSQLEAQPLDWLFTQSHPNKTSRPLPLAPSPCANNAACGSNCYQNFSLDRLFTLHELTSAQTVPLTSNPPNPAHPREPPAGLIHLPFAPQTLHVPLGLSPPLRSMSFAPPSYVPAPSLPGNPFTA